jgi:hypothetical protein
MKMKEFLMNARGLVYRPKKTITGILEADRVGLGFFSYFIFSLLYAVLAFVLYLEGVAVNNPLAAFIPPKTYYLWETFYMIPVCFYSYLLMTAFMYLFLVLGGRESKLSPLLTAIGYTYSIPLILLFWIPDVVLMSISRDLQLSLVPYYGTLAGLWTMALSALALSLHAGIKLWKSIPVTIVSMALGNVLTAILIR